MAFDFEGLAKQKTVSAKGDVADRLPSGLKPVTEEKKDDTSIIPDYFTNIGVGKSLLTVGEAVVEALYASGDDGRIPVVAVTGTNGKTTTVRLIANILGSHGLCVGMTTTDGVYIAGRRTDTGDCSGPKSARNVLLHPDVDSAVLETARGGVLREGLGFDRCDVAVVTNVGLGDHLGLSYISTVEDLSVVKRVIVQNDFSAFVVTEEEFQKRRKPTLR